MVKKIVTLFAIIGTLLAYTNISIGATQSDIDALNEKKQNAQDELDGVQDQKETATNELDQINAQISSLESEIYSLETKLNDLNTSIDQKQKDIEAKQLEMEQKEELLKDRLVAMYKGGGTSYLDVVLGSSNYIEMFTKYNAVKTIAEKDTELINEVANQKQTIETEKAELETSKAEVETVKQVKDAKNAELKAAQVSKQNTINNLSEEEKKLQKTIAEFEAAIDKAQEEIRNSTNNVINSGGGYEGSFKGVLEWPISYSYNIITSIFGNRTAPTAGASTNHGAIDIGVSYVPVYAPADGKVILAGWVSGYGNYIMIDHGNGYYTAFGHLSRFNVSVGTVVSTGQQIAVSGNTGISTGPHLHYEVYIGGRGKANRVDPLQYTSHPSLVYY